MKSKIFKIIALIVGTILTSMILVLSVAHFKFKANANTQFTTAPIEIDEQIKSADIELGKRIVTIRNGCTDCHGENLGGKLFADDLAIGKIYSANITPFNLKNWTNEEIARAIRYGINKDGRSLIFMPSFEYAELSREDLSSIVAYLRSVPEVETNLPSPEAGPMAKILHMLGKMPILLPAHASNLQAPFNIKPKEEATLEFGQYLAHSACVGCHGSDFRGGPIQGAPPDWLPAASLRLAGHKEWTQDSFTRALREGFSPVRKSEIRFPMPIAMTKQMNDNEINALWLYFSSLKE